MKVKFKRLQKIINTANQLRDTRVSSCEKFDVLSEIESGTSWKFRGFIFDIFSSEDWPGQDHEDAFVTFRPAPNLSIKQNIYDGAEQGDPSSRFTLAHELGHIHLHRQLAGRRFAREAHRKLSSRTNPREEEEANIFAGALLIPNSYIKSHTSVWDLKLRFGVSEATAVKAIEQAKFICYKLGSSE